MANIISAGAAWLADQLQAHVATTITYRRGATNVSLAATKGQTELEQVDADGFAQRILTVDFLLPAADLILSGSSAATLPARGDTIEETIGGALHTYTVLPGDSFPSYRFSDPHRKGLRIHTKQTSVV
jgi:hypothetical protein